MQLKNLLKIGVVCIQLNSFTSAIHAQALLNVAFGSETSIAKVGFAATGQSANDYWNLYSRDDGNGGYRTFGALNNLKWADGTVTAVGLTVANAPGAWRNGTADPMYDVYLYPFDGGNITVTMTNVPAGSYDVFLYGHGGPGVDSANSVFKVVSGNNDYGTKATTTSSGWASPVWVEGQQYVVFRGVSVANAGMTVTVFPGAYGQAFISGIQVVQKSSPPPQPPPPVAGPLLNVDFGTDTSSNKVGFAATGQSANDYWNLYSRDAGNGGYRTIGTVSNLKRADGTATAVGMTVRNAPGAWDNGTADPMYKVYLYPFDGGNITVTMTNVPAGSYDVFLYGHGGPGVDSANSLFKVVSGSIDYGTKATTTTSGWTSPVWQEGQQYVVFRDVAVANAGMTVTVLPGAYGQAFISGMQVVQKSSPPPQPPPPVAAPLLNVDFGTDTSSNKVGFAATGQSANDYWNLYSRDDGNGGYRTIGTVSNLKRADGTATTVGMTVRNAPGAWDNGTADPMYRVYLYPFDGGNITVTMTNVPAGSYDVFLYGHGGPGVDSANSLFKVVSGNNDYGTKATTTTSGWTSPVWQEGQQYVVFRDVTVANAGMTVTVLPGAYGQAFISGMQVVQKSSPPPQPPPPVAGPLLNVDFGTDTSSNKVGFAATGQSANDYWNLYSRDDGKGEYRTIGTVSNLKRADGTATAVGMTVRNAPGAWDNGTADPMYKVYLYPFDGGNITVTMTNMPAGSYDVFLYGHGGPGVDSANSVFKVVSGSIDYGTKATTTASGWTSPVWEEGQQYVVFRDIAVVDTGGSVTVTVSPGAYGQAFISGMQVVQTSLTPGCVTPFSGLVGWWRGNGDTTDAVGTNNGTLNGNATFGSGLVGQALSFDGVDDYVSIAPSPVLDVGVGSGLTIEFWIKPADLSTSRPLLEWGNAVQSFGVHFWSSANSVSSVLAGALFANVVDTANNYHIVESAGGILNINQFQHVALTYDKTTGVAKIYHDGTVVATQNLGLFTPQTSGSLHLGERHGGEGTGKVFKGLMDEIAVFNRPLSADEINAIYLAGSAGKCLSAPAGPFTNGSFESPALATGAGQSLPSGSTLITGWRVDGTGMGWQNGAAFGVSPVGGAQHIGFNGGNTPPGQATISQTFSTSVGQSYAVSFNVGRTGSGSGTMSLLAEVTSSSDAVLGSLNAVAPASPGYGPARTFTFTATTSTSTLTFRDTSSATVAVDPLLDNVSVVPVPTCVPAGLVSWWKAEGNANDSADGNHGVLVNGASFAEGKAGQAFSFDGIDDYVSFAPSAILNVGAGNGLTIESWIKPTDLSASRPLFEWDNNSGQSFGVHFWSSANSVSSVLPGALFANLVDTANNYHIVESAESILNTNQFQHIALTYDKITGVATIYYNGTVVVTQNLGIFTPQTSGPLYLGKRRVGAGAGKVFQGLMDEVAVYSRPLAENEIAAIYHAGSAGKCVPPLLPARSLAHWKFDETNGVVAYDSAGTFNGTLASSGASFVPGGVSGNAISLSKAANGYVNMGNVLGLANTDFSLVAWIKLSPGDTSNTAILGKVAAYSRNGYLLIANKTGALLRDDKASFIQGGSGVAAYTLNETPVSASSVNDGNWHQIVAVYQVGGMKSIYVDGAPAEDSKLSQPFNQNTVAFLIGGANYNGVPAGVFDGLIDEVQIYNYALANSDVEFLFQHPGQEIAPHDLPQGDWRLNAIAGSGGTITRDPNLLRYTNEARVTLTAVPAAGFVFTGWSGDASGTANPIVLTMTANKTVSADFAMIPIGKPLAHWKFDETGGSIAHDSSGTYNGTLSLAGASFVAGGRTGNALSLSKTNNGFVSMGNVLGLGGTDFSIVAWIKMAAGDTTDSSLILSKQAAYTRNGFLLNVNKTGGLLLDNRASFIEGGSGVAQITTAETPISTTAVNDGNWHQIVAVFQVGGMKSIYVDGAPAEDSKQSQPFNQNTVPFLIGGVNYNGIPTGLFTGLIDEVQIYDFALSASHVDYLFTHPGEEIPSSTCVPAPSGLVSWWGGDGNANDIQDSNNGALQNGTSFTAGKVGQAFSFDGMDDQVLVPHNQNQNVGNQITIDAWVYPSSSRHGPTILQKRSASNAGGYVFEMLGQPFAPDNGLQFVIMIGGTYYSCMTTNSVLTLNTWQHVAATYDGSAMRIYVNGVERASAAASGAIDAVTDPIVIGRNVVSPVYVWQGLIDEVDLFNRALSSSEIQAIYNAGAAGKCHSSGSCIPTGLVSWWKGDGNGSDATGSNHSTSMNGMSFASGKAGQAFTFNGMDSQVRFGNTVGNFGTNDFTIDFWIRTTATRLESVIEKWPVCGHASMFTVRMGGPGVGPGKLNAVLEQDDVGSNQNSLVSARQVNDGVFHHVALVRNGNSASFYIDGVLDSSASSPGITRISNSAELVAGRSVCVGIDGTSNFTGQLDELAIYNRALSASEIQGIYNAGGAGKCPSPPQPPPVAGTLLNVAFGSETSQTKVGFAATGQSANDYWNLYSRDDGNGGYRTFGALNNLKWADGTVSAVGLTVANAPGAWRNGTADPMYDVYLYPFDGGNITVTVTNLAVGSYDLFLYGHGGPGADTANSVFQVVSGSSDYWTKATTTTSGWTSPVWQEGQQYVVFRNVGIFHAGDALTITVLPGVYGQAFLSGMQAMQTSTNLPLGDWRLKTIAGIGGTITRDPDLPTYTNGAIVTVSAMANAGFTFAGWSGAASGTSNTTTVTMNGNKTVGADFAVIRVGKPLAHWKLDETGGGIAHDSAGIYDGVLSTNGASFVTNGIAGNALSLSRAANGFVNMGNVLGLESGDFSVMAWVKMTAGDATQDTVIVSKQRAGYANGYLIAANRSEGPTGGYAAANKAWFYDSDFHGQEVTSTTSVNDGAWHQIVGVYVAGANKYIYVDGAPAEASNASRPIVANPGKFVVGGVDFDGAPGGTFTGLIDEVQIYNYALNPAEVDFLFSHPGAVVPEHTLPVGWLVKTSVSGSGSITRDPDLPRYENGTNLTLTAIPAVGFRFTGWSGDATGTNNPVVVTVNSDKNITARFADAIAPTVAITSPSAGTNSDGAIQLSGTVSDNGRIASVRWEWNGRAMGSLPVVGDRFSVSGLRLYPGENRLRVIARDVAGNETTAEVVVTWRALARALAHWKFDETDGTVAHDSSGSYNGTLSPAGASFVPGGRVGNALSLSKSANGFVTMGDVIGLQNTDFSIIAWIKMSPGDTSDALIVTKHAAYSRNGYLLVANKSGALIRDDKAAFIEGGTGVAAHTLDETPVSTTSVNDGQWHQIVAVYQPGGMKSIYVDGAPAEDSKPSQPFLQNSVAFLIGGATQNGVPRGAFNGLVDEVQIYNYALTAPQVDFLFTHPSEVIPDGDLPVGWTLNTAVVGGGTIQRNPDLARYLSGTNVTLTAVTNAGFAFVGWTGDASGTNNPITLTMDANKTVTASFLEIPVRVLAVVNPDPQQEGERINFDLRLISPGDVGGMNFILHYDPVYLKDPQLLWSSIVGSALDQVNYDTPGEIHGAFALPATAVPTGTQPVASLSFRARSVPFDLSTELGLELIDASAPTGDTIRSGNAARGGVARILRRHVIGDNNANNRLDVGDATIIQRLLTRLDPVRPWDVTGNDLNASTTLDTGDIIRVLRVIADIDPQPSPQTASSQSGRLAKAGLGKASSSAESVVLRASPPRAQPGDLVVVQAVLENIAAPISGASFMLDYPTNALRLLNSLSLQTGSLVPASAVSVWNVQPAQNNYAVQNGKISFVASGATQWASNNGILAEFVFQVQPGQTAQYQWPIRISDLELTADGYDVRPASESVIYFIGRDPVPPSLSSRSSGLSPNGFSLSLTGEWGVSYRIEVSSDLATWSPLVTLITGGNGTLSYVDPAATNSSQRFYRAKQQ